jgi:hypothetical protein
MSSDPIAPQPGEDPDVAPSGDPDPIPTEPLPEQTQPGEDPGVAPDRPEVEPAEDPRP